MFYKKSNRTIEEDLACFNRERFRNKRLDESIINERKNTVNISMNLHGRDMGFYGTYDGISIKHIEIAERISTSKLIDFLAEEEMSYLGNENIGDYDRIHHQLSSYPRSFLVLLYAGVFKP